MYNTSHDYVVGAKLESALKDNWIQYSRTQHIEGSLITGKFFDSACGKVSLFDNICFAARVASAAAALFYHYLHSIVGLLWEKM